MANPASRSNKWDDLFKRDIDVVFLRIDFKNIRWMRRNIIFNDRIGYFPFEELSKIRMRKSPGAEESDDQLEFPIGFLPSCVDSFIFAKANT